VDALESARLKLIRASEHIKVIEQYGRRYARRKPHKIITDPKGRETAEIRKAPPDDIAVLAGEVLYQLRSALDHLAFDLVKRNRMGTSLPSEWEENCCFPLWTDPPKKPPVYNCYKNRLPNISKAAFAFIEVFSLIRVEAALESAPPKSWDGWLICQNIDKHRHLNVIETTRHLTNTSVG
jgi:hypothetical protein